jgi:5'-nucleotidase
MKNILLTNDDGIGSEGLLRLGEALSEVCRVYVCAPDGQRSASGHGITLMRPILVREHSLPFAERAYITDGTPVDCFKLGLDIFESSGVKIDMVFSGINHGGNLGTDTLYSGTVSAAIDGALCGFPSVAVSVNSHAPTHFEKACELAVKALRTTTRHCERSEAIQRLTININTPNLPPNQIKGVKVATLGHREYNEWYHKKELGGGKFEFTYAGSPLIYEGLSADANDIGASQESYATVTPLHFDLTSYELIEELKEVWDE